MSGGWDGEFFDPNFNSIPIFGPMASRIPNFYPGPREEERQGGIMLHNLPREES